MKNEELLQDAIGMIGDDLIEDADRRPRRPLVMRWSAVACACLAVIIAVSVGWLWRGEAPGVEPSVDELPGDSPDFGVNPPVSSPGEPMQDEIRVHSWQELKILYDASKRGNEDFLLALKSLDDQCLIEQASHMDFDFYGQKSERESFLELFNTVNHYSLLIPKSELETRLDYIMINPVAGGISLKEVYSFVYKNQEYDWGVHSGDFREEMEQQEGDPIDVITGNGYTAKIWLFREAKGRHQAYHGYIILDGADHPTVEVILSYVGIRPDDIPKELLPRFGEFDVTTVEEMLPRRTR